MTSTTAPSPPTRPAGSDAFASRPVWCVFEYALPTPDRSLRAVVWRQLRDMRALNVAQGIWAVVLCEGQHGRLMDLADRIAEAGGTSSTREVGYEMPEDKRMQSRLNRACERLWDDFFNAADFFPRPADASPEDRLVALDALQAVYTECLVHDCVRSDAGLGARGRLDELIRDVTGHLSDDSPPPVEPGRWGRVERASSWLLCSGDSLSIAVLAPAPGVAWELAFRRFERSVYVPSETRVDICYGTFVWTGAAEEAPGVLTTLQHRVDLFESSRT